MENRLLIACGILQTEIEVLIVTKILLIIQQDSGGLYSDCILSLRPRKKILAIENKPNMKVGINDSMDKAHK